MVKIIELVIVAMLLAVSFFAGVKYSESVKDHAGWLFESKEEEIELPDLSGEGSIEVESSSDMIEQMPAESNDVEVKESSEGL